MSKLPSVGTTIFTVMSKLANDHQAINLSQGFPNFPVDDQLVETIRELSLSDVHQYQPMAGSSQLLEQLSDLIRNQYNRNLSPGEEILVTAGATQGLFTAIMALVNSGDEVIILDPGYDSYAPTVTLAGGKPVHVPLNSEYLPDWDVIRSATNENTRMIITNNPHNPTGRVWSQEDMNQLEDLMKRFPNLLLLSDEVYEFITFEQKHISAHTLSEVLDRVMTVSSFGKTFHITGWKIGYLTAPKSLMNEIKKVHQFNVFCVNSLAQIALGNYLNKVDVNQLGAFYQKKRDTFASLMKESRFDFLPCEGTYFQTASYRTISEENDVDFCKRLTSEYGVAAIPISVFNKTGEDLKIIRFCFAKDNETLTKAAEKLCRI